MNRTYPSLTAPFSIHSSRGATFVSVLQKEVNAILARVPVSMFEEKLAEQMEECFDVDGALTSTVSESRLEIPTRILKEKNVMTVSRRHTRQESKRSLVKPTILAHTHSDTPVILWEKPCVPGYLKAVTREIRRRGVAFLRVTRKAQKHADTDRMYRTHTIVDTSSISTRGRMPKHIPAMQYQRQKFMEFVFSTVATFALFVFLLVRADFIPEVPRSVLAGQAAGPAFAVATLDTTTTASTTTVTTDSDTAPVFFETTPTTHPQNSVSSAIPSRLEQTTSSRTMTSVPMQTVHLAGALPDRIVIDAIDLDVPVGVPASNDISVLDAVLLKGAALYPGSGTLDQERNLLILGHSSHLPIVRNQAYRAFNNIEKLAVGDTIKVFSGSHAYVYRVKNVKLVPAPEAMVRFNTGKRELTLVTCDNFGAKTDRYVVSADFIGIE